MTIATVLPQAVMDLREDASDDFLRSYDTDPAKRKGNCYRRYPERASWVVGFVFERADGTKYQVMRSISRWAAEYAVGDWCKKDLS